MSYSISRLHTKHLRAYYAQGGEASKTAPTTDAELAIRSVPELSSLRGKIPDEQLYARARAIAYLDKAIKDPDAFFGKIKNIAWGQETKEIIDNFIQVRQLLLTETNSHKLSDVRIQTYFQGFDAPGDTNLGIFRTNTEVRNLLQKFLSTTPGHLGIISSIFPPEKIKGAVEISAEQIAVKTRIETFLLALGTIPNEYASDIRKANDLLSLNKVDDAIAKLRPVLKNGWNINVNDVVAKATHGETLRAIGNTQEAAKVMSKQGLEELKEGNNSPEQQALLKDIQSNFESEKAKKLAEGKKFYTEMIDALPANDPWRAKLQGQKTEMISEIASEQAYMSIMDRFIKNSPSGSKGLGKMFEDYNDMRGLYGVLNFSDENKKIVTESAVMLASFVLTAGLGAVLSAIAVGARVVATSGALAAAQVSEKANRARKLANTVGNVAKAAVRGTLNTVSTVAAVGVVGNEALQANKLTRTAGEALKFTTADTLIRAATRSEGEKSSLGFEQFATNLAKNTVMFGAFAGVEKFMNVQVLSRLKTQFNLQNTTKLYALLDLPVLTVGDIAVMQAMHAAETGKLELDMLGVFQGIAFRVGMRGTEGLVQNFPNLAEKFKQKYGDIRDRVRRNQPTPDLVPEGSFHAGGEYAHGAPLEPINPKNTLHLQPENAPKLDGKPKHGDRITLDGKEYRWSDKAQKWRAKGGETLSQKDVPTAKDAQGNPLLIEYTRPTVEMPPRFDGNIYSNEKGLQGKGEIQFTNGDKIVGEFKDGNLNGELTKANGDEFVGTFDVDRKPKNGQYTKSDGTTIVLENGNPITSKSGANEMRVSSSGKPAEPLRVEGNGKHTEKSGGPYQNPERLKKLQEARLSEQNKLAKLSSEKSISRYEIPTKTPEQMITNPEFGDMIMLNGEGWQFVGNKGNGWRKAQPDGKFHENPMHGEPKSHIEMKNLVGNGSRISRYEIPTKTPEQMITNPEFGDMIMLNGEGWQFVGNKGNGWRKAQPDGKFHENPMHGEPKSHIEMKNLVEKLKQKQLGEIDGVKQRVDRLDALISRESARPTRPTSETPQGKGAEKGDKKATAPEQNDPAKPKNELAENTGGVSQDHLKYKISKEVRDDIADAMQNGDASRVSKRIQNTETSPNQYDANIQEAVKNAKNLKTLEEVRNALETNFQGPRKQNTEVLDTIEREVLRQRAREIAQAKIDNIIPGAGKPITDAIVNRESTSSLAEKIRRYGPLAAAVILALLALSMCIGGNTGDKNPLLTPPEGGFDKLTPEQIAELCKQCAEGKLSVIKTRPSETARGVTLDTKRREDISKRWMGTTAWSDMIAKFKQYKTTIQNSSDQGKSVAQALDKVISNASVANVQLLQRCIAMDAVDNMKGQDGILGPNTTANILRVINTCINLPKAKVAQTVQPQTQSPPTDPGDRSSPMPGEGGQII